MGIYSGIIIGIIVATTIYIVNGYIEIYIFEKIRRKNEEKKNKELTINYAVNELELNRSKIDNFIDLLKRIEITETQKRIPYSLNLEIREKYEAYTQNFENLFFSGIEFDDNFKKELLSVYNKLLKYKNSLNIIYLYATPFYLQNEEKFWEGAKKLRESEAVLWLIDIKKIEEFTNKLKNYKI